jgi:ATP-dependent DNA helicase RecG
MNDKELSFILSQGEGQFVEFKEKYSDSIAKELVAFANATGGKIFIGITDAGIIKGVNVTNDLKSKIIDIANNCDPRLRIEMDVIQNILVIEVYESKNKPHACSSGFYLRIGANSQKLTRDEIFKFAVSEGLKSFDEELNYDFNYPLDFDHVKFNNYLTDAKIEKIIDDETILINLGVAKRDSKGLIFNNAGVLFFAKEPSKFFLTSQVVCAEYATNEKHEILDKKVYDDGIMENIKQAVNFIRKRVKVKFVIEKLEREEIPQFPENAYREVIVNAIMHRDYFDKSSDVLIEFFRSKLLISNPGGLVHWLKPEDFGKISKTRNSIIASLLARTIYVEKMGTGIRRIRNAMKEHNLPSPDFINREHYFYVTLNDNTIQETTQETIQETTQETTKIAIIRLLKSNPYYTRANLCNILNKADATIKQHLEELKENGNIKRVGSNKAGYWKIIK